jgi:hypothetical protein
MGKELKHFLQILGKEKSMELCLEATRKLRELCKEDSCKVELSEKGRKIKELCLSYGAPGARLAEVMGIMLDENLGVSAQVKPIPVVILAGVIPRIAGDKYNVGEVVIMLIGANESELRCGLMDGTLGGAYPQHMRDSKIPTDKEVVDYIERVFEKFREL